MKNVPTPLSCATAAHPELAYLFFPRIALTLLLFARPGLADAKRMGGEGAFDGKPSYNKPTPSAKDSPAEYLIRPSRWNGSVKPIVHKFDVSPAPYKPDLA